MSKIEKRYAKALVDIAVKKDMVEQYRKDMNIIISAFDLSSELKIFVLNPEVSSAIKKDVIVKLFQNQVAKLIIDFVEYLIDKDRLRLIYGITDEFGKMVDKVQKVLDMTVVSALKIDNDQLDRIVAKYKNLYNASFVRVITQVDPDLLGGVKIIIGDTIIDDSVKGKAEMFIKQMVRG